MVYLQPSSNVSLPERSCKKKWKDANQNMSMTDTSFNLNKARYEVRQLGIKGMSKESKEDAVLHKLIQLGAKVNDYTYTNCTYFNFFTVLQVVE